MNEEVVPSRVGELLAGKYQLGRLLGSGGVGEVYCAENTMIGRTVAIKVLRAEYATRKDVVARFIQEGRAANLVRHPNVVDVLDVDQDERGIPFIVQEYLDGCDLSGYLLTLGGRLGVEAALEIMLPVIDAVSFAHSRGVIHRDLKPENIFVIESDGEKMPKLLDFGISQIASSPGNARLTTPGTAMGTPAYMSPEQVVASGSVDARTDVWSLGVILFELLSGQLPFEADNPSAYMVKVASQEPAHLGAKAPALDREYVRIVGRCLRREREARYPSAAELARDLRLAMQGQAIEATGQRAAPRNSQIAAIEAEAPRHPASVRRLSQGAIPSVRRPGSGPLPELDLAPDVLAPIMQGVRGAGAPPPSKPVAPSPSDNLPKEVSIALDIRPSKGELLAARPMHRPRFTAPRKRTRGDAIRGAIYALVVVALAAGAVVGLRAVGFRSGLATGTEFYASLTFWWIRAGLAGLFAAVAIVTIYLAVRERPNSLGLALAGIGLLTLVVFEAVSSLSLYGQEGGDHTLALPRWFLIGVSLFPFGCGIHWAYKGFRAAFVDDEGRARALALALFAALGIGVSVEMGTSDTSGALAIAAPVLRQRVQPTARRAASPSRPLEKSAAAATRR